MNRLVNLLGRIGTILIAIGLALTPVYFIPTQTTGTLYRVGTWVIPPEAFTQHQSSVFSPQSGMRVALQTNATLDAYVFELSDRYILEWLNTTHPENELNTSTFQDFKNQHSDSLAVGQHVPVGHTVVEYVPTKVTNATLLLVNPSQVDTVEFSIEIQWFQIIASKTRLIEAIEIIIPVGLVLSSFWLFSYLKQRRRPKR